MGRLYRAWVAHRQQTNSAAGAGKFERQGQIFEAGQSG
jgi:hypothetical protein